MKVYLEDLGFTRAELDQEVAAGFVNARRTPVVPEYVVYDYTEAATYAKRWNAVTIASRGLIVDPSDDSIIARPFTKFFNDREDIPGYNDFPRTGPVVVTDKMDGSLGVLFRRSDGSWRVATRGSMGSDQAVHATKVFNERYADKWMPNESYTFLFEIVYPHNRVVLDYNGLDDLVLIGAVEKATGIMLSARSAAEQHGWIGPVAETFSYNSYEEVLNAPIPDDKEGYVVHFLDANRFIKLKGEHYLRLHRVMTHVTPLRVWEMMSAGKSVENFIRDEVEEEFFDLVRDYAALLKSKYDARVLEISNAAESVRAKFESMPRREFFALIRGELTVEGVEFHQILNVLDNKSNRNDRAIWLAIRPHGKELF